MSELTSETTGTYAKLARDFNLYLKLTQPLAFATVKLIQFMMRGVKSKFFDKDITENFAKFLKATNGDYSIFRVPFPEAQTRETAVENVKNYLDKAGVKYCILESVNENDKALHVSIARQDEQKFNVMFTDYLKELLGGGEKSADDLVNFTNGKTTIISVPDASLETMKDALSKVGVNYAELPDLIPEDGEKQLRIASVDLNTAKQCYEAYRHSVMKQQKTESDIKPSQEAQEENNVPEMKIISEDDYINTARRSVDDYIDSASDEIKEKIGEFEQLDSTAAEKEMRNWENEILDSRSPHCYALRSNENFSEISIDKETLVGRNPKVGHLERTFPNFFFCTVPGTKGQQTLMLPKNMVFSVSGEERGRYVAFVRNDKPAKIFDKFGNPDGGETYPTGLDLFKQFDMRNKKQDTVNVKNAAKSVSEDLYAVPKAAPVK